MATYSVHTGDAPEGEIKLVREGFSPTALLFGPFWFAWSRAWLGLAVWLAGASAILAAAIALNAIGAPLIAALAVFILLMALEASQFRRRSLLRRGFAVADFVEAADREEAEIRYLARRVSNQERRDVPPSTHRLQPQRTEAVGLFLSGA